jgi:beta-lactamase regulating signal transducer with metallopeptidase domain
MDDMAKFGVESLARLSIGSTVFLVMGLVAIAVCRRQSAATQYWIGVWTCLALLLLPPVVIMLPSWQANFLGLNVQILNSHAESKRAETFDAKVGVSPPRDATNLTAPSSWLNQAKLEEDFLKLGKASQHTRIRITLFEQVAQSVIVVYLIGLVSGLVRLFLAHNNVRKWIHSSQCVSTEVARIAEKSRQDIGLVRPVDVRQSQQIAVPVVVGMLRPTILLPYSIDRWSEESLGAVLTHELSHVERNDLWTQFIIQIVTCFYWPQPLVYWMAHILRARREVACDDRVLSFYQRPVQYARHLLEVATELSGHPQSQFATLAIARSPQIECRVTAILSPTRRRSPPTRQVVAGMALLTIAGTLVGASASPFTRPEGDGSTSSNAEAQSTSPNRTLHTVRGRVLFTDGRPAGWKWQSKKRPVWQPKIGFGSRKKGHLSPEVLMANALCLSSFWRCFCGFV